MDRLSSSPSLIKGLSRYAALALASALFAACGDPSCPAGSTKVNGRCEPAPTCREGEVEENGECVDAMPNTMGDAGSDAGSDAGEDPDPQDAGGDAADIPD